MRDNRVANNHVPDLQQSARSQVVPITNPRAVSLTALGHCALEKGAPQTVVYLRFKAAGLTHRNAFALASAGYAPLQRVYSKLRREFLEANPWCAVGGEEATEVHHRAGRVGADLLDVTRWLSVCHAHHVEITENPKWAIERGYSVPRIGRAS